MLPYYFIVNEKSRRGKAKKIWATVETELKRKEVEYEAFLTEYVGHATELAAMLSEKTSELDMGEFLRIVVVGGDGTMDEVINGISDFSKTDFRHSFTSPQTWIRSLRWVRVPPSSGASFRLD